MLSKFPEKWVTTAIEGRLGRFLFQWPHFSFRDKIGTCAEKLRHEYKTNDKDTDQLMEKLKEKKKLARTWSGSS